MKFFLLCLTLTSSLVFADFEKVTVTNLDIDYVAPLGKGTVEKVGIGLGFTGVPYAIEINRTDDAFELTTPYVDFTWLSPLEFLYRLPAVSLRKTSAALGAKDRHFIDSEEVVLKTPKGDIYKAWGVSGACPARAKGTFDVRLLEDCREKLDLTVKKVEVPFNFLFMELVQNLPQGPVELDLPADNVVASLENGNLFLQVYIRFWFYAGLRTWGYIQYENNHQTIAIRVDKIKFGYITVTDIVMKKLKELTKNPDVKIDPPWIRIDTRSLRENHEG